MALATELSRVGSLKSLAGFFSAIWFEILWSLRILEIHLQLKHFPNKFVIRRFSSDFLVFAQVFIEKEIDIDLPVDGLIIDAGANVGFTTAFFANKCPGAKIVAVEPEPTNCKFLRFNTKGFSNIEIVEGALWYQSEMLRIANPGGVSWAIRVEAGASDGQVFGYTIQQILEKAGEPRCRLLKLDIEGAEKQLFNHSSDWLDLVDSILVEVHGEEAMASIKAAISGQDWKLSQHGEKLYITRLSK